MTTRKALLGAVLLISIGCGRQEGPAATGSPAPDEAAATVRAAPPACGPTVTRRGAVISVVPSGGDDTASLQCALDAAAASPVPVVLRLAPGRFVTSPLRASGFRGHLRGAGERATVLTNPDEPMVVNSGAWNLAAPSAVNVWPALLSLVGGDLTVSDMTIRITGDAPTTGSDFGFGPTSSLVMAVNVIGQRARATFERLTVEGQPTADPIFGHNLGNAIAYQGLVPFDDAPPLSGSFTVRDCTIRNVASGTPIANLRGARVIITGNHLQGLWGADQYDLEDVELTFAFNRVEAGVIGLQVADFCLGPSAVCGVGASRLAILGNHIEAPDGVVLVPTFHEGNACLVAGNEVKYDAAAGHAVVLGPGTRGCLVVARGGVLDLGTGNHVVTPGR